MDKEELFYLASFNAMLGQTENILEYILKYIELITEIDYDTISLLSMGSGHKLNNLRSRVGAYTDILSKDEIKDSKYKNLIENELKKDKENLFKFMEELLIVLEKCLGYAKDKNPENVCALLKLKADIILAKGQIDPKNEEENRKTISDGLRTYEIALSIAQKHLPKKNYTTLAIHLGISAFYGDHLGNTKLGAIFLRRCLEQNEIDLENTINEFKEKDFKTKDIGEQMILQIINKYLSYKNFEKKEIIEQHKKEELVNNKKKELKLKSKALKNTIDG